jgi:type II secretory pathway pseudopilin PulG
MYRNAAAPGGDPEEGMGLVEIVVALFLLAVLALAFLPVLVQGLKQSAINATNATATQLVNRQIETARTITTCSGIQTYQAELIPTEQDTRGVGLQATRTVGACPAAASYPGTVSVVIKVTRVDTGAVVSTASTLVFLGAA